MEFLKYFPSLALSLNYRTKNSKFNIFETDLHLKISFWHLFRLLSGKIGKDDSTIMAGIGGLEKKVILESDFY